MKKIFMFLFSVSMLVLVGCADEGGSSANTQTGTGGEEVPTSEYAGQYRITYFGIQDNTTALSSDCSQDIKFANTYINLYACYNATILEQVVNIQPHREGANEMLSIVAQMQLGGDNITDNASLQEYAYNHIIFPVSLAVVPISNASQTSFNSKATSRGLTNFIIQKPGGNRENTNITINNFSKDGDNVTINLATNKPDASKRYYFELTQISPEYNNYVTTLGVEDPNGGLYAASSLFNAIKNKYIDDTVLGPIFNGFVELIND